MWSWLSSTQGAPIIQLLVSIRVGVVYSGVIRMGSQVGTEVLRVSAVDKTCSPCNQFSSHHRVYCQVGTTYIRVGAVYIRVVTMYNQVIHMYLQFLWSQILIY